jgi:hypothetical protein
MSHFTTIATQVRDIEALRSACQELGLELVQNGTARGYNQNTIPGEYVIRLQGSVRHRREQPAGRSFGMTADWWDGHVEKEVGPNYGRLLQLYGVHKASREARSKGYSVRRQTLPNGSIKLCILGV